MKTSIFLTSFLAINCKGSKFLTSPAMRVENCDASNRVIDPIPLRPAQSAFQFSSVPIPSDEAERAAETNAGSLSLTREAGGEAVALRGHDDVVSLLLGLVEE